MFRHRHRRGLLQFGFSYSPPSPPPPESATATASPPPPHSSNINASSFLIVAGIIIGVFIVSVFLHLLLRYYNRHCSSSTTTDEDVSPPIQTPIPNQRISSRRVVPDDHQTLIDSLPLFSFNSVSNLPSSADCAVCLSKFEPHDKLRLLPVCCHAFHSTCIDTWLASNHTCPLCRSTIHMDQSEGYLKLFASLSNPSSRSNSFRVEIGSVSFSRRQRLSQSDSGRLRSYSMGSFEYMVEEESEIEVAVAVANVEPTRGGGGGDDSEFGGKTDEVSSPEAPGSDVAAEVSNGRGWLKNRVDRLVRSSSSSLSSSRFRNSGRFFTGSSRRSDGVAAATAVGLGSWDLEGNEYGQEINSFFRWLSGV